jgi:signal transduction histidine kinase
MKTGSLRARVTVTTLALLAIVLVVVVTTVTLAYRAKLDGDVRDRVTHAGTAVERAGSAAAVKPLIPGLVIGHGDSKLRLNPSRTDTELGRLAAAFDQMLDALETAVEEARASDASTRRFLADASHELRNPIAALQVSVETLLREQPERPERDRLEAAVVRESERVGRLVDDLLGLARLESRGQRVQFNLVTIARPLIEDARLRAPRAAHHAQRRRRRDRPWRSRRT